MIQLFLWIGIYSIRLICVSFLIQSFSVVFDIIDSVIEFLLDIFSSSLIVLLASCSLLCSALFAQSLRFCWPSRLSNEFERCYNIYRVKLLNVFKATEEKAFSA